MMHRLIASLRIAFLIRIYHHDIDDECDICDR